MMSEWHSEMQGVAADIADTFGETLTITPCVLKPNFGTIAQPEHAVTVQGVFSYRSKIVFKQNSGGAMQTQEPYLVTREPIASFPRAALPWALSRGDRITRCCDGSEFEAKSVEPDGVSMIVAKLVQLGRQEGA